MPSKKIVVVFGATGNQGGSLIQSILKDPKASEQFQLRAVTRNPSSPAATAIAAEGVEVVQVAPSLFPLVTLLTLEQADLADKNSLIAALKEAYAVFAVTNWQEILNKETEIQYGKNIANAAKVKLFPEVTMTR